MIKTLDDFLEQGELDRAFIRYRTAKIYVRRGRRMVGEEMRLVLTRAKTDNVRRSRNIEINPAHTRTGLYREIDDMMFAAAQKYGFEGVYVENVLNDFLPDVLVRYGYTRLDNLYGGPPSFWRAV